MSGARTGLSRLINVRTKFRSCTRRIGVVVAVCLFHALAILALFSGGIVRLAPDATAHLQIISIPERHKPLEPPPPTLIRLPPVQGLSSRAMAAQFKVPLPQINIDLPTDAPFTTTTNPSSAASGEGTSVGAGSGSGAGHGSGAGIPAPPKSDVQIVLTQPMTPTGVQLARGQKILITARGTMNWYPSGCKGCTSTPDGTHCVGSEFYAPLLPCYSLIGRIGPRGRAFEVGSYKTVIADSSGELFLGVNDNGYPDNIGKWVATLSVADSSADSADKRPVNKALERLLAVADSAAKSGNWDAALASVHEAQIMDVKKTPYESFLISAFLGRVFLQKRDLAAAAPALESAAASPYASAEMTGQWLRMAAAMEFQLKDYGKAIALAQQALQYNPSDTEIESLIADSLRLHQPQ